MDIKVYRELYDNNEMYPEDWESLIFDKDVSLTYLIKFIIYVRNEYMNKND